jgi:eukaryotic translation elongation factor 1 epsilon-1
LNNHLESRSYLIGQSISLADIVVFYAISEIMKQLSVQEKDCYLNLSRWFDHLQQEDKIRQGGSEVNFSTIHLLGCTARPAH